VTSVYAGVASIAERSEALRLVVDRIAPQVDRLSIYLNDYRERPAWAARAPSHVEFLLASIEAGDLGDAGKFYRAGETRGAIYFALDDDLLYPSDYVLRTVEGLGRYGGRALVSWHGKVLDLKRRPWNHYLWEAVLVHFQCLGDVTKDSPIHVPGSGVAAFHTDVFPIGVEDFPAAFPNMADLHVARRLADLNVPAVALAHDRGFIQHLPIDLSRTLYARVAREGDALQTEVVNSIAFAELADLAAIASEEPRGRQRSRSQRRKG